MKDVTCGANAYQLLTAALADKAMILPCKAASQPSINQVL